MDNGSVGANLWHAAVLLHTTRFKSRALCVHSDFDKVSKTIKTQKSSLRLLDRSLAPSPQYASAHCVTSSAESTSESLIDLGQEYLLRRAHGVDPF